MTKTFLTLFTQSTQLCIVLLFFLCCLTACNNSPYAVLKQPSYSTNQDAPVSSSPKTQQSEKRTIHVVSHGWHTGVVIKKDDLLRVLPELIYFFPHSKKKDTFYSEDFIEIGWGDKDFYRSNQVTTKITLKAMFMAQGSIMHLVDVTDEPEVFFAQSIVKKIELAPLSYERLLSYINISLQRDHQNQLIHLGPGIYGHSQFFESNGTYSLLNTCNKWTAKALQSGGIKISPTFKLTSGSVMRAIQ